jgi:Acyclic terpene utilisation family protein AtuA
MLTVNQVTMDIKCDGRQSLEMLISLLGTISLVSSTWHFGLCRCPAKVDGEAEVNLAENAEAYAAGIHQGFEPTAWDGLLQSIDLIAQKQIKVVINGGGLNPKGLAQKTSALVRQNFKPSVDSAYTGLISQRFKNADMI